jgi:hypothetical protein
MKLQRNSPVSALSHAALHNPIDHICVLDPIHTGYDEFGCVGCKGRRRETVESGGDPNQSGTICVLASGSFSTDRGKLTGMFAANPPSSGGGGEAAAGSLKISEESSERRPAAQGSFKDLLVQVRFVLTAVSATTRPCIRFWPFN